jgi:hypothetical protein
MKIGQEALREFAGLWVTSFQRVTDPASIDDVGFGVKFH